MHKVNTRANLQETRITVWPWEVSWHHICTMNKKVLQNKIKVSNILLYINRNNFVFLHMPNDTIFYSAYSFEKKYIFGCCCTNWQQKNKWYFSMKHTSKKKWPKNFKSEQKMKYTFLMILQHLWTFLQMPTP